MARQETMRLEISAEARYLLEGCSPSNRLLGARALENGNWAVSLDKEVVDALLQLDPDIDRAIQILCRDYLEGKLNAPKPPTN